MKEEKETDTQGSSRIVGAMHKRRTTLADGRYLIYYTFGDEPSARTGDESGPEPEAAREAAEQRHV
jgi:hypothetical protein